MRAAQGGCTKALRRTATAPPAHQAHRRGYALSPSAVFMIQIKAPRALMLETDRAQVRNRAGDRLPRGSVGSAWAALEPARDIWPMHRAISPMPQGPTPEVPMSVPIEPPPLGRWSGARDRLWQMAERRPARRLGRDIATDFGSVGGILERRSYLRGGSVGETGHFESSSNGLSASGAGPGKGSARQGSRPLAMRSLQIRSAILTIVLRCSIG